MIDAQADTKKESVVVIGAEAQSPFFGSAFEGLFITLDDTTLWDRTCIKPLTINIDEMRVPSGKNRVGKVFGQVVRTEAVDLHEIIVYF